MNVLYYDSTLTHYGVKGMKWGIRHDEPRSGRRRIKSKAPKQLNRFQKSLANDYKKRYKMTDAQAEEAARQRAKTIRNVAIGTAAVAGIAIGTYLAVKYGREYGDDIIRAGTEMQTVHANPDIIKTGILDGDNIEVVSGLSAGDEILVKDENFKLNTTKDETKGFLQMTPNKKRKSGKEILNNAPKKS